MTFRKNKVFEFVTAVLYKTSFGRVGTCISYLLTHAVTYVIPRTRTFERLLGWCSRYQTTGNTKRPSDKSELNGKTLLSLYFRNTCHGISNRFTIRFKINIHYSPILKETSRGSIHKQSFSGKFALTSLTLSPLSFAAELNTGSKLSVIRRQRYPLPLQGFSRYQWPSNFFVSFFTTSSPKSCTRRRGSLLTR